jgi:hypothetical protein
MLRWAGNVSWMEGDWKTGEFIAFLWQSANFEDQEEDGRVHIKSTLRS